MTTPDIDQLVSKSFRISELNQQLRAARADATAMRTRAGIAEDALDALLRAREDGSDEEAESYVIAYEISQGRRPADLSDALIDRDR